MPKILTLNHIAATGLAEFDTKNFQVGEKIENPDAILVRSFNMHDYELPRSVLVIGRAGAGTNNIPIERCTQLGIPVLNTPGANANAVKELVITGMLLACRNIYPALNYVNELEGDHTTINQAVEKNKKRFSGFELPHKTLGVIGLGHIGVKVANAARYLGMNVIGYDSAMSVQSAWELRSSVVRAEHIEEVFARSDFITLHIPLIDKTRHLINADCLAKMRDNVVLLNFAREGIVDNEALLTALNEGKIRNYVCDFPNPSFIDHSRVIALPHLGASTQEAEENCAVMIANQIQDYINHGQIRNSVNFPSAKLRRKEGHRLAIVNKNIPNMLAQISTVFSEAKINIIDMLNKSRGEIAYTLLDINEPVSDTLISKLMTIDGIIKARRL